MKKNTDAKSQEFWEAARESRKVIATWPKWKQDYRITKFSPGLLKEEVMSRLYIVYDSRVDRKIVNEASVIEYLGEYPDDQAAIEDALADWEGMEYDLYSYKVEGHNLIDARYVCSCDIGD